MTSGARAIGRAIGPVLGLAATWILFAVLAGANFTSWSNQQLMLMQTAVVGTAAVGATWIIVAGGIDLSVGSTIALGTMFAALILRSPICTAVDERLGIAYGPPANALVAAAACVAVGVVVGVAIGAIVVGRIGKVAAVVALALAAGLALHATTSAGWSFGAVIRVALLVFASVALARFVPRIEISPFIATLGLWGALRGLAKGLGGSQPIYLDTEAAGRAQEPLAALMIVAPSGPFAILPPGVIVLVLLVTLAALAMRYTRFGRHALAIGSSEETARLCGIRVERAKLAVYALGVACAGVAALLQLSFLSMGDPTTAQGYELKVIAAAVIGGASLSGGQGSIGGTLVGALIMTVVDNGCTKLGLDNWVQEAVTGAIIVAAVALDRARR